MDIKMPNGVILTSEDEEVINSYIEYMGGVPVQPLKSNKKSATKVASTEEAE